MIATVVIISVGIVLALWLIDHRGRVVSVVRRRRRHLARRVVPGHTEAYEPLDVQVARQQEQRKLAPRPLKRAARRFRRRGGVHH